MKTELLALIENYGKALVYQTEGKISAVKDARNLMSNIVFMLDKAEQEEAAIGAGGVERLRSDAPAAVEPAASLSDQEMTLLEQAASMLEWMANDERNRGNYSTAEGAGCSADAVRRLASALAPAAPADALDAEIALRKVLSAVQLYLPPDGISIDVAMNEVIAAVDPWPIGRVKDES